MHKLTLSFKGRILKTYQPRGGQVTIGSDPACDIQIDNLAVSPRHLVIEHEADTLTLRDVGNKGNILVNGKVVKECELSPGDTIVVGKHTLTYTREYTSQYVANGDSEFTPEDKMQSAATQAEPAETEESGWLQFMNGPKLGRTLRLDRSLTRLGKTGKQSAMIASRNGGYYISHLEGETPTRVANRSIDSDSVLLKDGDTIQIGDIRMLFFLGK